jgi:starvation-inducible DNA-binding protein
METAMNKEDLTNQMKVVLATTFSFYLKAHYYHWNVTGPNFAQYHNFFGELYENVHKSIDEIAEEIRKLGSFAPGSLVRYSDLTKVEDETSVPEASIMFARLARDNDIVIRELYAAFNAANELGEQGLADYLAGKIGFHEKMRWMLKSF